MSGLKKNGKSILQNLTLVSQIGIMMLVPIVGCIIAGAYLDRFLGTKGIFLIIFVFLGVGSAFRNLFAVFKRMTKDYDNDETASKYVASFVKHQKHRK